MKLKVPDFAELDACIVDLDGTLVDTLGDFEVALNHMLATLDRPPVNRELIRQLVGKGSEQLIRAVLAHVELQRGVAGFVASQELFQRAWGAYQQHYLIINGQHSTVYPGAVEGLQSLRAAGLRLACLTNKPTAFARALLQGKGLAGYFSQVFGGDAFERRKPDPLPLLRTCEALSSLPANTLMIGDSSNDARAARAAGCPVVLVSYGYNHGQPVQAVDADAVIDGIDQLVWPRIAGGR
jgi:phosphoglycolate phosphatase